MTVTARITTAERDAEIAEHIRAADLELARFMQRLAPTGGLLAARQRLAMALKTLSEPKPPVQEAWTPEEILAREG